MRKQEHGGESHSHWRRWLPLGFSLLLLTALFWQVSPREVFHAFGRLNWAVLVPATVLLVIALYLWDSLCLWWLFSSHGEPVSYRAILRARGTSYLFAVINYGLGYGMLAWLLARHRGKTFLSTAARCVVVTYVDLCVLMALGIVGGLLSTAPNTNGIAWACGIGLLAFVSVALAVRLLPPSWTQRLLDTRLGQTLHSPDWSWSNLLPLAVLRAFYAGFGILYVAICLAASGFDLGYMVVMSVIPIVVLVDALPISFSGLGSREAVLLVLLNPADPQLLIAFSLVWWACEMGGRALIGLGVVWSTTSFRLG